jgi:carbamoyltransferase
MRDVLNLKIKRRESFRPLAPAVLAEHAGEWLASARPDPFMTTVCAVREDKRALVPAVTHADGTARPQTVTREDNPALWAVLDAFASATGVPLLLNTSFNESEPIVNTPAEALSCFLRTSMDRLVLEEMVVTRD